MAAVRKINKKNKKRGLKSKVTRIRKRIVKRGTGIINKIIDKLPFEVHVPSYQFCGPGTNLKKRLARGDKGINPLDSACREHDIAYSKHSDSQGRSIADKILQKEAMKRFMSKDAAIGERTTALGVAAAMKVKRTFTGKGFNCCKNRKKRVRKLKKKKPRKKLKTVSFNSVVKNVKISMKKSKPTNIDSAIKVAVASIKKTKKGKHVTVPRTIKVPHYSGGVQPLVPIFAGLSALGAVVSSGVGIASAINQTKKAQMELEETKRHNRLIEGVVIGNKVGQGFYLHNNKQGNGFYLKQSPKNH